MSVSSAEPVVIVRDRAWPTLQLKVSPRLEAGCARRWAGREAGRFQQGGGQRATVKSALGALRASRLGSRRNKWTQPSETDGAHSLVF